MANAIIYEGLWLSFSKLAYGLHRNAGREGEKEHFSVAGLFLKEGKSVSGTGWREMVLRMGSHLIVQLLSNTKAKSDLFF